MSEYYLPPDPPAGMPAFDGVVRDDWAWIPNDPDNRDWAEYQEWLKAGNEAKAMPAEELTPAPKTA